jgi:hypothetical protein
MTDVATRLLCSRLAVSALLLAVVGCAVGGCQRSVQTFRGNEPSACNAATIVPENPYNRARHSPLAGACGDSEVLVRINGQRLGGTHNSFTILPGTQELQVAFRESPARLNGRQLITHSVPLRFQVEGGHTYAIRGRSAWAQGRPSVTLWAFDGTSGKVVASLVVPAARTKIVGDGEFLAPEYTD